MDPPTESDINRISKMHDELEDIPPGSLSEAQMERMAFLHELKEELINRKLVLLLVFFSNKKTSCSHLISRKNWKM